MVVTRSGRWSLLLIAVLATYGASAGCSGGGDGPVFSLTTGTYRVSNYVLESDECDVATSSGNGFGIQVVVLDTAISMLGLSGTIDGNRVRIEDSQTYDSTVYDCEREELARIDGALTANDRFDVRYAFSRGILSGNECDQSTIPLPCTSVARWHLAKEEPTPTPTPSGSVPCTVAWFSNAPGGTLNVYLLTMPRAEWTTGSQSYDPSAGRHGRYYYRAAATDLSSYEATGIAVDGTFDLVVAGTMPGDSVSFTDSVAQTYFDGSGRTPGPSIGSGGTGTFDGEWSDGSNYGTGTVEIAHAGSNLTIGLLGSYAICAE